MELKDIRSEIKELIQDALQDFLSLVVEDKWQERLYSISKKAVAEKKLRGKYKKAYNKLDRMNDKSKFSTKDMDTTLIVAVTYYYNLYNKKNPFVKITPETQLAIYALSDARNDYGHLTGNESPRELYEGGLVSLYNLKKFLETVYCNELSIDEFKRKTFKEQYLHSTEKLTDLLEEAHAKIQQTEKIQKDIQRILDSDNLDHAWLTIGGSYIQNWKPPIGEEEYISFITEAAKTGIVPAYPLAADYYYYIAKDYDMAEKYLSYLYLNKTKKRYNKDSMLMLANIYLNKLSEHQGDDREIVKMLIADGHDVRKSDDGKSYIFIYRQNHVAEAFSEFKSTMTETIQLLKEAESDSIQTESVKDCNELSNSSNTEQINKAALTVHAVSASKNIPPMGRQHIKKTDTSKKDQE